MRHTHVRQAGKSSSSPLAKAIVNSLSSPTQMKFDHRNKREREVKMTRMDLNGMGFFAFPGTLLTPT